MTKLSKKEFHFSNIYWFVGRAINHLGLLGLLGICLILVSSLMFGLKNISAEKALINAQEELDEKILQASYLHDKQKQNTLKPKIFDFYEAFPTTSQLSTTLRAIKRSASKNKLGLDKGDYKFTLISKNKTKVEDIAKYEIKFPLYGNYIQIRKFISEVLLEWPTLALSEIQLERESNLSPMLNANLTFIFFTRGGS
jgi:hypothetical protein